MPISKNMDGFASRSPWLRKPQFYRILREVSAAGSILERSRQGFAQAMGKARSGQE